MGEEGGRQRNEESEVREGKRREKRKTRGISEDSYFLFFSFFARRERKSVGVGAGDCERKRKEESEWGTTLEGHREASRATGLGDPSPPPWLTDTTLGSVQAGLIMTAKIKSHQRKSRSRPQTEKRNQNVEVLKPGEGERAIANRQPQLSVYGKQHSFTLAKGRAKEGD